MNGRPLAGVRVVITRAARQAEPTARAFAAAGAAVARLPLLEVAPPRDPAPLAAAARDAAAFDWLIFTSANAVQAFLPRLIAPPPPLAAVGPATAAALRDAGHEPAVEPRRAHAEGLLEALVPRLAPGARVLLPQADDARPTLAAGLRAAGARVTAPVAYRKRLPAGTAEAAAALFGAAPLGWVTFTSPRTVRCFAELFADTWASRRDSLRAISIGPITSGELRRRGVARLAEARRPTPQEMVLAMVAGLG